MYIANEMKMNKSTLNFTLILLLLPFCILSCTGNEKAQKENQNVERSFALEDFSFLKGKSVTQILRDSKGNMWFATDGYGVCFYNGTAKFYTKKDGPSSDFVRDIREDKLGNLLFYTRDGISYFKGKLFTEIPNAKRHENEGKGIQPVLNTYNYSTQNIWSSAYRGVQHFDGSSMTYIPLPIDEADKKLWDTNPGYHHTVYSVYSTLIDKNGKLWIGTELRGAYLFDGKTFRNYREKGLDLPIRAMFQDSKGVIWFGTNGEGVIRYDGNTFTNLTEEKGLGNPGFGRTGIEGKSGTLARVFAINEDNNGGLWFATVDSGVWYYKDNQLKNYMKEDGLASNIVVSIFNDNQGNIWFGTENGISVFDGHAFVGNVAGKSTTH